MTTPQPGHMFCTGVTKLDHARCIYGEENYILYNARINCRPTIKSTPTVLGVFRQALDHNQSPVIFITKPGHLTVVRRTLLFWIIGIVTQAVSMRDVEKRVAAVTPKKCSGMREENEQKRFYSASAYLHAVD